MTEIGLHKQGGNYFGSIRKAFWPAAIALGFLVFLGAVGNGNTLRTASADEGDICEIEGPEIIAEGKTYFFIAWLDLKRTASSPSASTTSRASPRSRALSKRMTSDDDNDDDLQYEKLKGTNLVHEVAAIDAFDVDEDFIAELQNVDKDFKLRLDVCQDRPTLDSIAAS